MYTKAALNLTHLDLSYSVLILVSEDRGLDLVHLGINEECWGCATP